MDNAVLAPLELSVVGQEVLGRLVHAYLVMGYLLQSYAANGTYFCAEVVLQQ